jgi:hypothetical protein
MRRFQNLRNDQLQTIVLDAVNELEFRRRLNPMEARFLREDYVEAIKLKSQDIWLNTAALTAFVAGLVVLTKGTF